MRPVDTENYFAFVRQLPCAACGRRGYTVPAHYHGYYSARLGRGGSRKCSDLAVAPLCDGVEDSCHKSFDANQWCLDIEDNDKRLHMQSELFLSYVMETLIQYEEAGGISWRRVA